MACLLLAVMACQKDPNPRQDDHGFQLNAADIQMEGSLQPSSKAFENGTKYAMFVLNSNSPSPWTGSNPVFKGMAEENNGYINFPEVIPYNGRTFNFYGLTMGNNEDLMGNITYSAQNEAPVYHLEATPEEVAISSGTGTYYHLPDLRRGELLNRNANNSDFVLKMPFKHSLAMLRLEVVRQDDEEEGDELNNTSILYVKLHNAYAEGNLNVETGDFDFTGSTPVQGGILLYEGPEDHYIGPHGDTLASTLIFPYNPGPNEENGPLLQLEIKANKNTIGTDGVTFCDIAIPATGNEIRSNVIYTIRINVTTDEVRVLTIVPTYFEWLEAESATFEMGTPVNFNGVLWSDRNLGATNPNPLGGSDAWNESVGYFYQFGRNIPYFPNEPIYSGPYWNSYISGVDLNTTLSTALAAGNDRPVYPVLNIDSWGSALGDITTNNINWEVTAADGGNFANNEDDIIWQIGVVPGDQTTKKLLGFYSKTEGIPNATSHWISKEDHPCPAGWRLPNGEEWKSIMPFSAISGNIALRQFQNTENPNNDGDWTTVDKRSEPNFEIVYAASNLHNILVPKSAGALPVYESEQEGRQAYTGGFPYLQRTEENDPRAGKKSTYVISFDDEYGDRTRYTCENGARTPNGSRYTYNFGKIYCIKNQGDNDAYRLRWSIQFVGTAAELEQDPRCVIVIERFPATANDVLSYDNVREFDWSHPVEILYLPIAGLVSPTWKGFLGKLVNVGGEVNYAAYDEINNKFCNGCWIKTVGTETNTMQISAGGSQKGFGMQVRCVRDTEY